VIVDTRQYDKLDYGYALTIHKGQGVTVDRAYMLATKSLQAEGAYVGMTRHRKALMIAGGLDQFDGLEVLARSLSRGERKEFGGYHDERERELEHGARHTIAMRRATQFSNAPRPLRPEKTLTQAVNEYVDAWLADHESRALRRDADIPLAKDVAALKRAGVALKRFDGQLRGALDELLEARVRDDRAWRALVELTGKSRARMLVAEVEKARAEGRAVNTKVFGQSPTNHSRTRDVDLPRRRFSDLSREEQRAQREAHRDERHRKAGLLARPPSRRDKGRGGYGFGDD
jgi:hypothetical protein